MGQAITVRFDTLDEFIDELTYCVDTDSVDGDVVRAQEHRMSVNDGVERLFLKCGFTSNEQLREACILVGDVAVGGEESANQAYDAIRKDLKSAVNGSDLELRGGRFELVVA